mgnify:CR=1 FL=1
MLTMRAVLLIGLQLVLARIVAYGLPFDLEFLMTPREVRDLLGIEVRQIGDMAHADFERSFLGRPAKVDMEFRDFGLKLLEIEWHLEQTGDPNRFASFQNSLESSLVGRYGTPLPEPSEIGSPIWEDGYTRVILDTFGTSMARITYIWTGPNGRYDEHDFSDEL